MKMSVAREYALSLDGTTEEPHFKYSSFRVQGRIYATVPPEETHLHLFVSDEQREIALAVAPEFLEPLYWGKRVCGLRASLAQARPALIKQLLQQAWEHKTPKPRSRKTKSPGTA